MEDCIFCKIIKQEIPSEKIWEDENFLAFLDIKPITEGTTLIVPKKHLTSNVFENEESEISNIMIAGRKVSQILKQKLNVERCIAVFEGLEINHLHLKLYPTNGKPIKYMIDSGYSTTLEEIQKIGLKIRND